MIVELYDLYLTSKKIIRIDQGREVFSENLGIPNVFRLDLFLPTEHFFSRCKIYLM